MAEPFCITVARFWSKVEVGKPTQCWPWKGGTSGAGYGRFRVNGKLVLAHHFAWVLIRGPLPEGEGYHGTVLRHGCDNPPCCNPFHTRSGTQQQNVHDMDARGRRKLESRLTDQEIAAIADDPRPQRAIAAAYGIPQSHVYRVKRGWRPALLPSAVGAAP